MNSASSERERLITLLAAVEDPPQGAALPSDDPLLVAVARHHRLTPLLSALCAGSLPATLADTFRRDRVVTTARNMVLGQVAEECLEALTRATIPAIVLKGLEYEMRLYGAPGVRPTSDIDLLVPNNDRRRAFAVLDRLAFEPRAAAPGFDDADYHEVAWTRRGIEVDLHLGLAPFARCAIDYAAVWSEARPLRLGRVDARALHPVHAAIFHSLHMAIDHFAVPAIYLCDLTHLVSTPEALTTAATLARSWRCYGPFSTAIFLAATFLPRWASGKAIPAPSARARQVIHGYGPTAPLPRVEQLWRKLIHFDKLADALRYVAVQTGRNVREGFERRIRKRSTRERLAL